MKKLLLLFLLLNVISLNARSINSHFRLSFHNPHGKEIISAYVENSNIFIEYSDRTIRQLTFTNSDSSPIMVKRENAILFIRNVAGSFFNENGDRIENVKKIMKVNCNSLIEKTIIDRKPFRDGADDTYYILNIEKPTLSLDGLYVYFLVECYVTSDELVKVDLRTGKMIKIFPADYFELIKKGQYKGLFFVGRSEIKGGGRDIYYYLVNEKNETLKEFDSEYNYKIFKKNSINN